MTLTEYTVQEIFKIQDFRDWWRTLNSKEPSKYRIEYTPEEWVQVFALYKKYLATIKEKQNV